MGATNCPETPRQRMIGMMYLVLTAMLALNVSKSILDAFIVVNEAMEQTSKNFDTKIKDTYERFDAAEEAEPEKVQEYNKKAKQIQQKASEMVQYIQSIKEELFVIIDDIKDGDVKDKNLREMKAKDNYTTSTTYFIGQANSGKAFEMREKIEQFKEDVIKIVNDTAFEIPSGLNTKGPFHDNDRREEPWEMHYFYHTIPAAAYTLLNKMIGEVRNMEFETVNYLFSAIDAGSHKFDKVEARVIPNSRIVFAGDAYEADIIVAAIDTRQNPTGHWKSGLTEANENMVGTLTTIEGKDGVVNLRIPTSGTGDQKFAGLIELMGPDGNKQFHPFNGSYTVTKPAAAVAAEKMNVFYAGIPNPVAIAAPVAPERLRINWGGATATPLGGGRYDVNVTNTVKELTITVSADMDGKTVNMGSTTFRVKTVPNPTVFIGGTILGGKQPKDLILANPLLIAKMSPDFNYELRWSIVSYRVTFVRNGVEDPPISITGPHFGAQVTSKIQAASAGTIIEFSDIRISSIAGTKNVPETITVRIR
jgi:gliding motility-associated protein GldM